GGRRGLGGGRLRLDLDRPQAGAVTYLHETKTPGASVGEPRAFSVVLCAWISDLFRVYLKTPQHCPLLPERRICCVAFACIPQRSAALMRLASAPFWRMVQHF